LLNSLGPAPGSGQELLLEHDYLEGRGAQERDATITYTDGPAVQGATVAYEWRHGIGAVVNALVGAGLRIDRLREIDQIPWPDGPTWKSPGTAGGACPPRAPHPPSVRPEATKRLTASTGFGFGVSPGWPGSRSRSPLSPAGMCSACIAA